MSPIHLNATARVADEVNYFLLASCDAPDVKRSAVDGKYYFSLTINSISDEYDDFQIYLNGVPQAQFHVEADELPKVRSIGPFDHSSLGGTYYEYILQSLNTGVSDTLYVKELACGVATSNGLNKAGYYCRGSIVGVIAQTAPESVFGPSLPEKTYVYVLISSEDGLVKDKNFSGRFTGVSDLTNYEIHAFATSFERSAEFISDIKIGQVLDQNDTDVCFGLCGIFPVETDCSSFDMSLKKELAGDFIVHMGDTTQFNIIVKNEGRVTAYNTVVQESPPEGLVFVAHKSPFWNTDLTSKPIPVLLPGESIILPIYFYVSTSSRGSTLENLAEIIFSASTPGSDVPAFDKDSEPNNQDREEDDQDAKEILLLENFCTASFEFTMEHKPICEGEPIIMAAKVIKATGKISYLWRFNNQFISTDSVLYIENHNSANFGRYSLTVIDEMGCNGTEFFDVEPVLDDESIACYNDIDIGVNNNCSIYLRPDMLTRRHISGIDNYLLEIRTLAGQLIDIKDLSSLGPIDQIEVRLVNPCNGKTHCWTHVHLRYDYAPKFNLYEQTFVTHCDYDIRKPASELIEQFNYENFNEIIDAQAFKDSLDQAVCVSEYEVTVYDTYLTDPEICIDNQVVRIYQVSLSGKIINIDTAIIRIESLSPINLYFPPDKDNISCHSGLNPVEISSFPYYIQGADTLLITGDINETKGLVFCTVGITYSDQFYATNCINGTSKVIRTWSSLDWCSNQTRFGIQYLYTRDQDPPIIHLTSDTIRISADELNCLGAIDLVDRLEIEDFCDPLPILSIENYPANDLLISQLNLGLHEVILKGIDRCGNVEWDTLFIEVIDSNAPIPILDDQLIVTLQSNINTQPVSVPAVAFDRGSHDNGCGTVSLQIVRKYWLDLLLMGPISVTQPADYCAINWSDYDSDNDGYVSREELFSAYIQVCCADIAQDIPVVIRVTDQYGNFTETEVILSVTSKEEVLACDDGDPCTINDQMIGTCPCQGIPDLADKDFDQVADCQQDSLYVCAAGISIKVAKNQFEGYILDGASPGRCILSEAAAMIAGEVFTADGVMVEKVSINSLNRGSRITNVEGKYAFDHLPMYDRYELTPTRNDDPLNGVTALDLVLIKLHILGLQPIIDPYQLIAADANGDGKISALDIVDIRKLLLGISSDFPSNSSWRFILENYEFDDIRHPFPWAETNVIGSLEKDMMDENWIGVKIGDVSNSAIANSALARRRTNSLISLKSGAKVFLAGESVEFSLKVDELNLLTAMQFQLIFNGLEIKSIESNRVVNRDNYHIINSTNHSNMTFVWYDSAIQDLSAYTLTIRGKAKRNISLNQDIFLVPSYKSVAYDEDWQEYNLVLRFEDQVEISSLTPMAIKLHQNQPNPFTGNTLIQFELPASGKIDLVIYNANGKLVYKRSAEFGKGVNAINLTRDDLKDESSVLYYSLHFNGQKLTKSMINTVN
jgi:uncharacterized repeat protein (TIGR01451 family)